MGSRDVPRPRASSLLGEWVEGQLVLADLYIPTFGSPSFPLVSAISSALSMPTPQGVQPQTP